MSDDRRRFRWDSGRLGRGPIQDFWQVSLTVQDPSIPNLPLETPTSGGAYSLTADAGTLTLTGQAASLERGRVVGATGASYALSVGAADLAYGRQVVATGGAYSLSVGDAGLASTRTIPADGAAVALTGSAASLEYGRVLDAGGGTLTLTVGDAALEYGGGLNHYTLTADGAAYSAAFGDANLEFGRVLNADGGTVALTVSDASLDYVPISGGTIFRREKYYRPIGEEEPKPKKVKKRRVIRLINDVAKRQVQLERPYEIAPLVHEFQRFSIDWEPKFEAVYWDRVKAALAEIDDEEAILLLM